ncbi:hypothetical protein GGS23DRAFT_315970 [Durotheca rogersii]|uniref:uncharacterized protein n=1 Tax=Durotheca rogersii TaxID=419775 RepID=UPI0022206970|nr:uncharacterized protein GGS23DRAFT_315970 [Durotheca rogersii]KAI5859625.1 hypothetical protein GGS23DRAFT_315970 [Durotheca rogersii]
MYRPIQGGYLIPEFLPESQHLRKHSILPLTLGPYAADLTDVMQALCHISYLSKGQEIDIGGERRFGDGYAISQRCRRLLREQHVDDIEVEIMEGWGYSRLGHDSIANTQFDSDANESVSSSKSSPNQPRPKQIQFTQNMLTLTS